MTVKEAYDYLELLETCTLEDLDRVYAQKIEFYLHKSHDGDSSGIDNIVTLTNAYTLIRDSIKSKSTRTKDAPCILVKYDTHNKDLSNTSRDELEIEYDEDDQDDVFINQEDITADCYVVSLHAGHSYAIPEICPVCLKRTTKRHTYHLSDSHTTHGAILPTRTITTYSSNCSLYCCCNRFDLANSVQVNMVGSTIQYYFKNKEYAKIFARINGTTYRGASSFDFYRPKIKRFFAWVFMSAIFIFIGTMIYYGLQ